MANRYWVGGTANWDNTAGTKWSTTSGGAGGASVPTSVDDVFFTNLSTGTCTIASGNLGAKSINCTGFTGTITGSIGISVFGSVTLDAGMTYTHIGTIAFFGTGTLTTAGKTFSGVTFNGVGSTVTLGDALNIGTRILNVVEGTFNTANYNVSAGTITSNNSNSRTINLGSSTVTLILNTSTIFTNTTNLTFNAGTSEIILTAGGSVFAGANLSFYNVSFTNTSAGNQVSITGSNTFNNLTLNPSSFTGLKQLSISDNQTVTGTFTCSSSSITIRNFIRSNIVGIARTITANAISANNCDFKDITIAGSASGTSPTSAGDCGGNSGILFSAPKTVYWNLGGTVSMFSTGWATTPSGTPNINNFPLAQDTATFTNSGVAGTVTNSAGLNIGTLDASGRTSAMTLSYSASNFYGDYTLGLGVTVTGASSITFAGSSTQTFTSAGKTIPNLITIDKPVGVSFELGDATTFTNTITLTRGTFDAKNYNLTCNTFSSSNSNVRTIFLGSSTVSISGNLIFTTNQNLTFNAGTSQINMTGQVGTIGGGSQTFYNVSFTSLISGTRTIQGINTFNQLSSVSTVAHTIDFSSNQTIGTWLINGSSGNIVTVKSNVAGTRRTINLTNVTSGIDYLSVKDIGITDANKFYVGSNSIDGGNNLNVYFTIQPVGGQSSNYFLMF